MAEDSDLERTEPATSRRLEEAREKGNVPRSRELNTFAVLIVAAVILITMGPKFAQGLAELLRHSLTFDRSIISDPRLLWSNLIQATLDSLWLFFPMMLVLMVTVLAAPAMIGGWLLSIAAVQPDFGRLNPLKGVGRIFSTTSLVELIKAIAKTVLVGSIAFWVLWHHKDEVFALADESISSSITHIGILLVWTFLSITGALALIVGIDVPFQLWDYAKKLRMTKEEVRQESKESEGNPQIKQRIRTLQREAARKRMMSEVPKADVIVTNPTRYAVALQYDEQKMRAPRVVAKGSYLLAERIRELGAENGVPILRTPPLARALYKHGELDQEIPAGLFSAVAEVLAYVYQLRSYNEKGGSLPQIPENLPVPEGMDFLEDAE